jgi:hypothetical protein
LPTKFAKRAKAKQTTKRYNTKSGYRKPFENKALACTFSKKEMLKDTLTGKVIWRFISETLVKNLMLSFQTNN